VHGVEAACDQLLEEGLDASIERHELAARVCRAGIRAMGLELWPRTEEITAACVTAVTVPAGLTDVQVRGHVRANYGVMISGGQGAGNLVRIGHMGPTARGLYPVVGVVALGRSLVDLGVEAQIGDGVEAARRDGRHRPLLRDDACAAHEHLLLRQFGERSQRA